MIDNTNVTQLDFELQLIARTAKSQLSVVNKFFFEERLLFNFLRSRMSNSWLRKDFFSLDCEARGHRL